MKIIRSVLRAVSFGAFGLALLIILGGFFGVQAGEQDGDKVIHATLILAAAGALAGLGSWFITPPGEREAAPVRASILRPFCVLGMVIFVPVGLFTFAGAFLQGERASAGGTLFFLGIGAVCFGISYGLLRAFRALSREIG